MILYPITIPGGSDTQFQYNNGGIFGGNAGATFNDGTGVSTFTGATITNCAVLGSDSAVFQPNADSTTFFQVKNAAGTDNLVYDTTNNILHLDSLTGLIHLGQYNNANTAGLVFRGQHSGKNVFLRSKSTGGEVVEMQDRNGNPMQVWDAFANIGFPNIVSGHTFTFDTTSNIRSTMFVRGRHTSDAIFIIKETSDSDPGRTFHIIDKNDNIIHAIMGGNGATPFFVGLGEPTPETPLEITFATPVIITGHASTHSDADESGLFEITGKREDGAGTETETGHIKMWHDGAVANDQLAKMTLGVNTGAGVVDTVFIDSSQQVGIGNAPTIPFDMRAKIGMTSIGGLAIKLTNTTGVVTVQGQTVKSDPTTDDAVILTVADDNECIGVFLEAGIADDAEAWVVVAGIADVAMGDDELATAGNWVETNSAEAGYADATSASPAAAPQHFNEIGHCIETVAAGGGGTHILARCVLHFN